MPEVLKMIVAGMTHLGCVTSKIIARIKSNIQVLNFAGRGDRISKKLGGKYLYEGLSGMSLTNDDEFCFFSGLSFSFTPSTFECK